MIILRMKKYKMILIEKPQKHQPYHQEKLTSMNILNQDILNILNILGEEILSSNQKQITKQAKFTYSLLRKAFEEQTKTIKEQGEVQVKALISLESPDKQLSSTKDFILKKAKS